MMDDIPDFLERAWQKDSKAKVVYSDLKSLSIYHAPPASDPHNVVYERIEHMSGELSVLRIAVAAYLLEGLPEGIYIEIPRRPNAFKLMIPQGVRNSETSPVPSDDEVFATHHRHSDFDLYTLTHDKQRALQFFRWKSTVMGKV